MRRSAAIFTIILFVLSRNGNGQTPLTPNAAPSTAQASQAAGFSAAPPEARYYRLICLVHLKGSGRHDDPVRPEFLPTDTTSRDGILAWSSRITDDGKMAIIHVVAANRKAFDPILSDHRPELRVFEIGKQPKGAIEAELRKYLKDFDLSAFQVTAQ